MWTVADKKGEKFVSDLDVEYFGKRTVLEFESS